MPASRKQNCKEILRQSIGVRILLKEGSDIVQQTPPKTISRLARGFAPRFGGHFGKIIPRIFEINRQFSRRKAAVHPANAGYCDLVAMSRWFSFAFGEIQLAEALGVSADELLK